MIEKEISDENWNWTLKLKIGTQDTFTQSILYVKLSIQQRLENNIDQLILYTL